MNLKSVTSLSHQIRQQWADILIILVLALVGGSASYLGAQMVNPEIFSSESSPYDVWFGADLPRVFFNMIGSGSHYRTKVHPLFSLIASLPVSLLTKWLGIEQITAVRIVIAGVASLWLGTLFIVLRLLGCRRLDGILFSLLGATSAASVFWFTVPETYSFGSLTILIALGFVLLTEFHQFSVLWYAIGPFNRFDTGRNNSNQCWNQQRPAILASHRVFCP